MLARRKQLFRNAGDRLGPDGPLDSFPFDGAHGGPAVPGAHPAQLDQARDLVPLGDQELIPDLLKGDRIFRHSVAPGRNDPDPEQL